MKKSLIALALVGAFAAPAFAEEAAAPAAEAPALTGNIGLVTNYVFRGISQSQNKPALQGGFDYNHSTGLYIGFWASNVGWVDAGGYKANNSLETDFYAGFKGSFAEDFTFDVGAIKYYYPGTAVAGKVTPDTIEGYAAIGWKFLTLKYSHTLSQYMVAWSGPNGENTRNSNYLDLAFNYDLGNGWGVNAHAGRQEIKNYAPASYTDWKLGVTKDIGYGVVGLAYTDTDAEGCGSAADYCWNNKSVAKAAGILSFTKTF